MLGNNPTCQRSPGEETKIKHSDQYGEKGEINETFTKKIKSWQSPNEFRSAKFVKETDSEADENVEYCNNYNRVQTPPKIKKSRTLRRLTPYNARRGQVHKLSDDDKMAIRRIGEPLNITDEDVRLEGG